MPYSCAILDDYQNAALSLAVGNNDIRFEVFDDHISDPDELVSRLGEFDIILAMRERTPFRQAVLERLPNLKLLVTTGMKNASIDIAHAAMLGITVVGTQGSGAYAAEIAWSLLLSVARNIPAEVANIREGGSRWQTSIGTTLSGRTLGIVGLGRLGEKVARYGLAFGMEVVAWSRSNTPKKSADLGIRYAATLDEVLTSSDAISLHLALNAETRGIIGARELGLMKSDAIIINTSRGPLIDERALLDSLGSGTLRVGLDVFDIEPLPIDHPFRQMKNVVATPHLGYVTEETYRVFFREAFEDMKAWAQGSPVRVLNSPDAASLRR